MTRPLKRLLLVEDEPDIQAIARLALEAVGGFEVAICSSGAEAVAAVHRSAPDLILLDVMMPGIDGPATLRLLKADALAARLPVVFLTAKASGATRVRYLELGAVGMIAKPFDPMRLSGEILAIWEALPPRPDSHPA